MPAIYDKSGIRFQYPENWTLETEDATADREAITVYSPGGAFWSVIQHPAGDDPATLATAARDAMKREYDDLDSEEVSQTVGEVEMVGFDLNFYCLDLTNTAWIRAFRHGDATYLLIAQGEDREFEKLADVFRAITISMLAK